MFHLLKEMNYGVCVSDFIVIEKNDMTQQVTAVK